MVHRLTALVTIIVCLIGFAAPVSAQETPQPRISISGAVGTYSKYVVDNGAIWSEDPVVQGNVTVTFNRCGGYVDLWGSKDFNSEVDFGDEIDVTAGWIFRDLNLGVTFMDYAKVFGTKEPDFFRPFIEIPLPTFPISGHRIQLYSRYEYYAATRDFDLNSGGWAILGIRHRWELSKHWAFRHQVKVVYDGGVFASMPGFLGVYDVGVDYALGSATWNVLSVRQSMIPGSLTDRENRTIVSTSVSAPLY